MRVAILTAGSRGDVAPYAALGHGLRSAGHQVRLATYPAFRELALGAGLDFFPFQGDLGEATAGPEKARWQQASGRPLSFMRSFSKLLAQAQEVFRRSLLDSWNACRDVEAIVAGPLAFGAPEIARAAGLPFYWALLQPMTPTRAFPHFLAPPSLRLGGGYNRLTYGVAAQVFWRLLRATLDDWRRQVLGQPPRRRRRPPPAPGCPPAPVLYGFSRLVVPPPRDWGEHAAVTGYWHLDDPAWQPPRELADFLAGGPPPVYVRLDSVGTAERSARQLVDMTLAALARTGQRGLLAGHGAIGQALGETRLPAAAMAVGYVPYEHLFDHAAAAVLHCGAGSTAAALRAGIPTIGLPRAFDQVFWARRVAALGVAPPPLERGKLTVERLAAAIAAAVSDPRLRQRAAALGAGVRAENGPAAAADAFERLAPLAATAGHRG